MSEINWYVVRAVSGQEKKIKTYIENEAARRKLDELIPSILIPTETITDVRNGKKRTREKNFFPGYIPIFSSKAVLPLPKVAGLTLLLWPFFEMHPNPRP
mgnify:CR=1 FL=1